MGRGRRNTAQPKGIKLNTRGRKLKKWQELEYRLDICRATKGAHIEVYGRA